MEAEVKALADKFFESRDLSKIAAEVKEGAYHFIVAEELANLELKAEGKRHKIPRLVLLCAFWKKRWNDSIVYMTINPPRSEKELMGNVAALFKQWRKFHEDVAAVVDLEVPDRFFKYLWKATMEMVEGIKKDIRKKQRARKPKPRPPSKVRQAPTDPMKTLVTKMTLGQMLEETGQSLGGPGEAHEKGAGPSKVG
jgi:hypothetical protein